MRKKNVEVSDIKKAKRRQIKKGKHTEIWKVSRVKYKEETFLMDLDTWKWDEIYMIEPEHVLQKVDMWKKIKQV